MYIRWLSAIKRSWHSLSEQLDFEFSSERECCAEWVFKDEGVLEERIIARVGLIMRNSAVTKRFRGDCWSVSKRDGRLQKTRNPRCQPRYREVWVVGGAKNISAIAARWWLLSGKEKRTIKWFARKYNVSIIKIRPDGRMVRGDTK